MQEQNSKDEVKSIVVAKKKVFQTTSSKLKALNDIFFHS
jgi:hypothetical protein